MRSSSVSIIIPLYNAAGSVQRSVESVLRQSYPDIQVIVVDGGSEDGSVQIIQTFGSRISEFISEKDSGIYDAINKGLDRANGEWVYVLGADDELAHDDVIAEALKVANINTRLLFGDVKNIHALHVKIPLLHKSSFGSGLIWKNTLHQQGTFYHRTIFQQYRFDPELKVLGDYDLHLKLWIEKIPSTNLGFTVAICDARGLSKEFSRSLYKEELKIKKRRLSVFLYLINIPWVWMKYIYKKAI